MATRFTYTPSTPDASIFGGGLQAPTDLISMIYTAYRMNGVRPTDEQIRQVVNKVDAGQFVQDRFGAANKAIQDAGLKGFSSQSQFVKANESIPGHNRAGGLSGFVGSGLDFTGKVAGDLIDEPGVQALLAAGGAGALMGGPAAVAPASSGTAAAGGTAGSAGGTGLTVGGGNLGLTPAATGAAGVSGSYATGALAPGYFTAETLVPAAAGVGAGVGSGTAAGGAAGGTAAPSVAPAAAPAAATAGTAATGGGLTKFLTSPSVIGAVTGATLAGGLDGSRQAGTIKVEEGIPDWLQPYVKPALDKYSTDLQNYQIDPYGILPSSMQEFQKTISGMYLDPSTNKYLEDYFRLGSERIKGALSPSFGHMQAFGAHSGYNEALSRGLSDFSVGLYGGAYDKERDRQTQFTANAPQFIANTSTASFAPYQQYLTTVGSLGKSKKEPYFENPWSNALGGGSLGYSLGSTWK